MGGMTVEQMTQMSYFLTVMAIIFAFFAGILFFAFDIRRIWKMLCGRSVPINNRGQKAFPKLVLPSKVSVIPVTEKLEKQVLYGEACTELFPLNRAEETIPLETVEMKFIQDITYTEYLPEKNS